MTKFYAVRIGRNTGIFTNWISCQKQVDGFSDAKYKSFKTREEAEAYIKGKPTSFTKVKRNKSAKKVNSAKNSLPKHTKEQVEDLLVDTKIFTDGACNPNPGEAGSGISIYRDGLVSELWYGLYNPHGTNNTAELNALYQAFLISKHEVAAERTVAVFCDSKYSIQCVTQWATGWKKKGWKKSGGEIKNLELIKKMFALYQSIKDNMTVFHVNGHAGIEGNELADRMSVLAIDSVEEDFCLYREEIDIEEILSMRDG